MDTPAGPLLNRHHRGSVNSPQFRGHACVCQGSFGFKERQVSQPAICRLGR